MPTPRKPHAASRARTVLASSGVLKPRPTLRNHLRFDAFFSPKTFLKPRKTVGCFWNAFSVCGESGDV